MLPHTPQCPEQLNPRMIQLKEITSAKTEKPCWKSKKINKHPSLTRGQWLWTDNSKKQWVGSDILRGGTKLGLSPVWWKPPAVVEGSVQKTFLGTTEHHVQSNAGVYSELPHSQKFTSRRQQQECSPHIQKEKRTSHLRARHQESGQGNPTPTQNKGGRRRWTRKSLHQHARNSYLWVAGSGQFVIHIHNTYVLSFLTILTDHFYTNKQSLELCHPQSCASRASHLGRQEQISVGRANPSWD